MSVMKDKSFNLREFLTCPFLDRWLTFLNNGKDRPDLPFLLLFLTDPQKL